MNQGDKKGFMMGLVTGIAVIVILGGVYMLGRTASNEGTTNTGTVAQPTQPTQPNQPSLPSVDGSKVAPVGDGDYVRGNPNASITMIEYSDFECPFCARFRPTVDQALAEYPNDVRFVYRHFPLRSIHPQAQKAAEAAECAGDQGAFYEMHDELFDLNEAGTLTLANMKQAAADIGLNTSQFDSCLDSGEKAADVEADYQNGISAGVSGTPGTFINGEYVAGALPYAQVKSIIDAQL